MGYWLRTALLVMRANEASTARWPSSRAPDFLDFPQWNPAGLKLLSQWCVCVCVYKDETGNCRDRNVSPTWVTPDLSGADGPSGWH